MHRQISRALCDFSQHGSSGSPHCAMDAAKLLTARQRVGQICLHHYPLFALCRCSQVVSSVSPLPLCPLPARLIISRAGLGRFSLLAAKVAFDEIECAPGEHILPVLSVRVGADGTHFSNTSSTDPKEQVGGSCVEVAVMCGEPSSPQKRIQSCIRMEHI